MCVQSCPDGLVADDDPRVCRNTTGECTCICMHACVRILTLKSTGITTIAISMYVNTSLYPGKVVCAFSK